MCGYAMLNKPDPEMVIVTAIEVNTDNIRELWDVLFRNIEMPEVLEDPLEAAGK